jgi:D-glycero-alpha-D-manno-heptose-7-phosphate kinase
LEHCLVLFNTQTSRVSSEIIAAQSRNVERHEAQSLEAMHKLKEQAVLMKECLLKGNIDQMGEVLDFGWQYKKQMAEGISNPQLDEMYEAAKRSGATGGKISGAGGGGFMIFFCPGITRYKVVETLTKFGGRARRFGFTKTGLTTWTI